MNEETGVRRKGTKDLAFTIATGNVPELVKTAEVVTAVWREIGVEVHVEAYNTGELNTNVIRPREYEALFFGEVIGRSLDLFAFWHSTQRSDPGLNLALYVNPRADKLLSEARASADSTVRAEKYAAFAEYVREDIPAIFLYAPEYVYVMPSDLHYSPLSTFTTGSDRFTTAHRWYREVEYVWPLFSHVGAREVAAREAVSTLARNEPQLNLTLLQQ